MNTRDSLGLAVKATYVEILEDEEHEDDITITKKTPHEIYKDPITDDGTKKSAKGLLRVEEKDGTYILHDQQTWDQEKQGALEIVFKDGKLIKDQSLSEIRERLWKTSI